MRQAKSPKISDGIIVNNDSTLLLASAKAKIDTELKPSQVDLRRLIDQAVDETDWVNIFRKFREMAVMGDKRAAEFLVKYRFGLPPQMVQHTGSVSSEIRLIEVIRETPAELRAEESGQAILEGESDSESEILPLPDELPELEELTSDLDDAD